MPELLKDPVVMFLLGAILGTFVTSMIVLIVMMRIMREIHNRGDEGEEWKRGIR